MEEKQKIAGGLRRGAPFYQPKNGYNRLSAQDEADMKSYCEDCKKFLSTGETERERVTEAVRLAEAKDFKPFARDVAVNPGDKPYRISRGKALMLAMVGTRLLSEGVDIDAAHIDSPWLDFKPNPLYEDAELTFFKTHYYGGIRKYQWATIPLELRGVVALKDGSTVAVSIGGAPKDPQSTIGDLLLHPSVGQSKRPLGKTIPGENLNLFIGNRPFKDDGGSDRMKLAVMDHLSQKYHIVEEDFIPAELEVVPAFKAADIGSDRSLIDACGHDDRVCGLACLAALLVLDTPGRTAACTLADKEEIDPTGVSGMRSAAFDTFVNNLRDTQRVPLKTCYEESFYLSADVTAVCDPNFAEVYEKRNDARVNYGTDLCKCAGSRGRLGASDASAEVVAYIHRVLDEAGVVRQMAELGKVDTGGDGTVAYYMAERDIDAIDAGVPVLSVHAPFETVDKLDCYITYKRIKVLYEK